MRRFQTVLALLGLALLSGVALSYRPHGLPVGHEPPRWLIGSFLLPAALLAWGLLRGRPWARWSGTSLGLAIFPWAFVLTVTPSMGVPITRQVVALAGSTLILLATIPGRSRQSREDSTAAPGGPERRGSAWIRWSLILNLASIINLGLFVVAYTFRATWQLALLGSLLGGLLLGVVLLSRRKTVGLLLLAASAVCFVPAAGLFVGAEARGAGEGVLFAVLFAPGIIAAMGTLLVFGKPLLRLFRDS